MSWAGTDPLDLYIGTRGCALADRETLRVGTADSFDAGCATLAGWLMPVARRRRARCWLSGGLARAFLVPAITGLRGEAERRLALEAAARQRTGLDAGCSVWVEPTSGAPGDRLGVATAAGVLERVSALASGAGLRLAGVAPWWSAALRTVMAEAPVATALCVRDDDALTVLCGAERRFERADTQAPLHDDAVADAAVLRALMSRRAAAGQAPVLRLRLDGQRSALHSDVDAKLPFAALCEWRR